MVHSVDSSKQAMEWCGENIVLNGIDPANHIPVVADIKDYLTGSGEKYNMIILDPPCVCQNTHRDAQCPSGIQVYQCTGNEND